MENGERKLCKCGCNLAIPETHLKEHPHAIYTPGHAPRKCGDKYLVKRCKECNELIPDYFLKISKSKCPKHFVEYNSLNSNIPGGERHFKWKGGNKSYWKHVTDDVVFGSKKFMNIVREYRKKKDGNLYCCICGREETDYIMDSLNNPRSLRFDRHHIDGNDKNNTLSNIDMSCHGCHMDHHWMNGDINGKTPIYSKYLSFNGKNQTYKEWAIDLGINWRTLYYRIHAYKWTTERALTTPVVKRERNKKSATGHI
jgi:hypothetical protein